MKKVLVVLMTVILVASMLMAMASSAVDTANGNGLSAGTDFNKICGKQFVFAISTEGYLGTEYNAQGNPIARRAYDFETMVLPLEHVCFLYEYDTEGNLKNYGMVLDKPMALTIAYDENGRGVSAETTVDGAKYSAFWDQMERAKQLQ